MKAIKTITFISVIAAVSACENNRGDTTRDYGRGDGDLSELQAGIWVDPRGCDHWIIDDGIEGYLSARLDRDGKPVCSGAAPPGYAIGNYKGGADVGDSI
ncbi:MAG: hypothetical protein AAGA08_16550 [Pseudomonadota bacterium]